MKKMKRACLLLAGLWAACFLMGCQSLKEKLGVGFPYKTYVEGVLEAVYYGDYEKYQLYTQKSTEAAIEHREAYVEAEAEFFAEYLNIENISSQGMEALTDLIKDLYSQVRFEVQSPVENNRGVMVEVVVYPVDFFGVAPKELETYIQDYNQKLNRGELDNLSTNEQKQKYEDEILAICEKYKELEPSSYQVSVNLQIEEVQEGYYQITDGMEKLDELVIQYKQE